MLFLEDKGSQVSSLCDRLRGVEIDLVIPLFVFSDSAGTDNALGDMLHGLTNYSIIGRLWIATSAAQGEVEMLEFKDIGTLSRIFLLERGKRAA